MERGGNKLDLHSVGSIDSADDGPNGLLPHLTHFRLIPVLVSQPKQEHRSLEQRSSSDRLYASKGTTGSIWEELLMSTDVNACTDANTCIPSECRTHKVHRSWEDPTLPTHPSNLQATNRSMPPHITATSSCVKRYELLAAS